jgi:hypothetical protein
MSNGSGSARPESQCCAAICSDTPSFLIEGASIGRPAMEARYRDGPYKADLVLPPETKRWSSRHKAAILVAVRTGVITREEACQRYLLSEEEFTGWEVAFDRAGIPGLRVTRLQSYRRRLCHSND